MMSQRARTTEAVISVAFLLAALTAAATDAPVDVDGGPRGATVDRQPVVPVQIEVANAPTEPSAAALQGRSVEPPEATAPTKEAAAVAASAVLSGLDQEQKLNAVIELEPFGDLDGTQLHQAGRVESLWASGQFAAAIQDLENLEAAGASFAVGIAWKQPVAVDATKWYPDVQVSSRLNGETAAIDYHGESGTILVLLVWSTGWTMNISTDLGQSFSETYVWSTYTAIADMSISGDDAWVGYTSDGDAYGSARFRRFAADTGAHDAGYAYHVVADETPNTMTDLAVLGNAPDGNNRIYMAYIVDETNALSFWWDDLVALSFDEVPTGISNAAFGLDLAWNANYPTGHARWISYLTTDGRLRVYKSAGGSWEIEVSQIYEGISARTAISAFNDHVYCAYECAVAPGVAGTCAIKTDDAGASSWHIDHVYEPTGSEPSSWAPDISVGSGVGRAAVFSAETGAIDDVYYTSHYGWDTDPWTNPLWYNTYDHVSGDDTYIEWIGLGCVSTYGMLYFDDPDGRPYFDLMTARSFFCDGFEGGGTGAWSSSSP